MTGTDRRSNQTIPSLISWLTANALRMLSSPNLQSDDERDHDDAPREKTLEDVLPPVPTLSSYDFRPVDSLDSESEGEAEYHRKAQYAPVLLLPSGCAR